ncbi:MAG: hypothetical protein ABIP71_04780 [Verrucomicrobiota bacterium]
MKTILALFVLIAVLTMPCNANAQARKLTQRIVNPDNTLRTPNAPTAPTPPPRAATVTPPPATVSVLTNAIPEKTKEQKAEIQRKTIEFQKKKAEEGAPSAQYDLGMRYLDGDGLEKDLTLAKKWLTASATNGNSQAVKKLESLNKK